MPASHSLKPQPRDYLIDKKTWPKGPFQKDAPDIARFVMEIAQRLEAACKNRSQHSVAKAAGLDPKTVNNILNGTTWGTVHTLYQLEETLKTDLWPNRKDRPRRPKPAERPWWMKPQPTTH